MSDLINKNVFRLLAIYSMSILFLPIFVNNIPPPLNILTRTLLLGPIWLFCILIYNPDYLVSKYMLSIYMFFIILTVGSFFIWNGRLIMGTHNITIKFIVIDLYGLFLPILMYLYFLKTEDYKGLAWVTLVTLIFILITSITSIIGLNFYPGAVRLLASGRGGLLEPIFLRLGIADYGFFGAIAFIPSALVYFIKGKNTKNHKRLFILLYICIIFIALAKAEFTTALIIAGIFFIYSFSIQENLKITFILFIVLFYASFYILQDDIANIFYALSDNIGSKALKERFKDVGDVLVIRDFVFDSGHTYFSVSRLSRVKMSFDKFLNNPLIGSGWGGGHSTWIDRLGLFGILGFFPWIVIFMQQITLNLSIYNDSYKIYYLISIISCLLLGTITTLANSTQSGAVLFFIIPGMYFFKYLNKNN